MIYKSLNNKLTTCYVGRHWIGGCGASTVYVLVVDFTKKKLAAALSLSQ